MCGKPADRIGQGPRIIRRHQQRFNARSCDFAAAGDVSGNQRASAGGGLEEGQRQSLPPGRQYGNVGGRPEASNVVYEPEMREVAPVPPRLDLGEWDRGRVGRIRKSGDQ